MTSDFRVGWGNKISDNWMFGKTRVVKKDQEKLNVIYAIPFYKEA